MVGGIVLTFCKYQFIKYCYLVLVSTSSTDHNDSINKSKTSRSKDMHLPISRVRTIMKSTPDIENIGLPSLHVVTKATVNLTIELR